MAGAMSDYCAEGIHLRDTVDGVCLECGDHKSAVLEHKELEEHEPPRGAVVMSEGAAGTAWQRFSSGRWHATTGKSTSWERLLKSDRPGARLRVIYLPPRSS